jgi:hypothetical protein
MTLRRRKWLNRSTGDFADGFLRVTQTHANQCESHDAVSAKSGDVGGDYVCRMPMSTEYRGTAGGGRFDI